MTAGDKKIADTSVKLGSHVGQAGPLMHLPVDVFLEVSLIRRDAHSTASMLKRAPDCSLLLPVRPPKPLSRLDEVEGGRACKAEPGHMGLRTQ